MSEGTWSVVLYRTLSLGVMATRRKMLALEGPSALRDSADDAKIGVPATSSSDPAGAWAPIAASLAVAAPPGASDRAGAARRSLVVLGGAGGVGTPGRAAARAAF